MQATFAKPILAVYLGLFLLFLYGPFVVLAIISFQTGPEGGPQFPIVEWSTYWYRHLTALERALDRPDAAAHIHARRADLERIDAAVRRIRIPISFVDRVYDLRGHIDLVRQRLALMGQVQPAIAAE